MSKEKRPAAANCEAQTKSSKQPDIVSAIRPAPQQDAAVADLEWFASHRGRNHRLRLALPDEIEQIDGPAPDGKFAYVAVQQLEPAVLARLMFWGTPAPVDTDSASEDDCAEVFSIISNKRWGVVIDDLREVRR